MSRTVLFGSQRTVAHTSLPCNHTFRLVAKGSFPSVSEFRVSLVKLCLHSLLGILDVLNVGLTSLQYGPIVRSSVESGVPGFTSTEPPLASSARDLRYSS